MKTIFVAARFVLSAILAFAPAASAQTGDYREVPILRGIPVGRAGCFDMAGVYDAPPRAAQGRNEDCIAAVRTLNVDFESERLIYWEARGDCHLQVRIKVFRSDTEKRILIVTNNLYGGCRAGGRRNGWLVIAKPPEGYEISRQEVRVDRIHRGTDGKGEFVFPKPPPSIVSKEIQVSPIDVAGCLGLTGQSQWVITTPEFLEKAIADHKYAETCREHFRSLKIDFQTHTLVGVSFASGYCQRPDGLTLGAVRETSSDGTRDRLILRIRYDDAGANYCPTWTTYPVWVLMPRIGEGYRFELDAGKRLKPKAGLI